MMTVVLCLIAIGFMVWGFVRARPLGRLGLIAWFQSVSLMAPWVLIFGLMGLGVILNFAAILVLLLVSIGSYIALGRRLRALAAEQGMVSRTAMKLAEKVQEMGDASSQFEITESSGETLVEVKTIPAEDLQAMRGIFGIDTFFVTEMVPFQSGMLFKGNLRGEPQPVYEALSTALEKVLGDRYRLFLVEGLDGRPVCICLPRIMESQPIGMGQRVLAVVLGLATLVSCVATAGFLQGVDLFQAPVGILQALPIGLGLFGLLVSHEVGHQVLARHHGVKFSWPFFFPAPQLGLGSFGALNRFESVLPSRQALFDVAFAGPATGGLLALVLVLIGLGFSHPVVDGVDAGYLSFPTTLFKGSILIGTLARIFLGDGVQAETVAVHPLFIIGWLGLVITALNLMPAGQLDGGRMVQAIYGRKLAGRTTVVTLVLLGLVAIVNPVALYWAIIILFLQRELERPCLNDLTEPDDTRAAYGLLALFLMIAVLLPLTPSLAGQLGLKG
jgi:membrane-associated protease RseP (regulator of RpoE activity)